MKTQPAVIALSLMVLSVGCQTTDPNSGEKKASNTSKGAAIGAIAGAAVGVLTSNKSGRTKGVVTGAALGAAAGGGAGYVMDRQEQKLREKMRNSGVEMKREGNTLNVVLPGDISFDTGSSMLNESFREPLSALAQSLNENPESHIQVFGHTDSTGEYGKNLKLSQSRAQAVSNYLQSQGVSMARLSVAAIGPDNPVADNKTAEGRAKNRRVEIKIVPDNPTKS
jgi:outer membrane protein OmpA-like peptidoglycan-associated protein